MKKRILSILLAALMIVPMICALPITASAEDSSTETIYSWNGFAANDIRKVKAANGQVVDLGFSGPVAIAPELDGSISKGEYTKSQVIPHLNTSKTTSVTAHFAVYGDYLYVAVDTSASGHATTSRSSVQYDIGVAASGSGEATWNRLGINVSAAGVVAATRSPFVHEVGASEYSTSLSAVRNTDYLVDTAYSNGFYEAKFDLGQLYRLFANLPGGQKAWDSPTINFSFWMLTGSEDHFCISYNFATETGRKGDWVSNTVIIPAETLDALEAKYKGVIGPLGYDYRNAVAGQLVSIKDYATVTPTVDGKLTTADGYTTTGSWTTNQASKIGNINCNFSVKDGYLYGAFVCDGEFTADPKVHFGTFAAVNSSNMRDSRCQTTINKDGSWSASNGGMWKIAQGPTTARKLTKDKNGVITGDESNNWTNVELNSGTSAHAAWKNVAYAYDAGTNKSTVEFQINIPNLLAVLQYEGYNPVEANAVQFMFWPAHASTAAFSVPSATQTQIQQTNGYGYGVGTVLPTVELPKGCAELYTVSDVDDMGAFGQRTLETKQSVATVDGTIGAGEYTASNSFKSNELFSYNKKTPLAVNISQTDYYSYDENYFYYGAKIYDPDYYTAGSSNLQLNISVLNKHDPFTVTNTYTTVTKPKETEKDPTTWTQSTKTVKTIRENYIDIADVITRASWGNTLYDDHVGTSMASKPGSVIRSQTLTNGDKAADAQAAFKTRANTFGDAGYEFDGSYDAATKIYTFEAKIPLAELKNLFQLGDDYDINSINIYTLYKFIPDPTDLDEKGNPICDYTMTYQLRDAKLDCAWEALRTLTQASKGSTGTPYNENTIPNVVKFVDAPLTKDSASVRLSTEYSGLRFKSVYTNEYLAWMAEYAKAQGATMEIGTLIAPADYITGEFTHAALLEKYGTDATSGKAKGYVEVIAKIGTPYANANGVTTIAGSLVNIKEGNLARDFAGRGFIKIGNEYFYTDTYTVKNVSEIADAALDDTKTAETEVYKYEVSAGVWSPYSEGQRTVLNGLIAK